MSFILFLVAAVAAPTSRGKETRRDNTSFVASGQEGEHRRRLDGVIFYPQRKRHVHQTKYKEKTVRPVTDAWSLNVFFNPASSRHKRRRSAAYVALTARDFDPTVRALRRFALETGVEVRRGSPLCTVPAPTKDVRTC